MKWTMAILRVITLAAVLMALMQPHQASAGPACNQRCFQPLAGGNAYCTSGNKVYGCRQSTAIGRCWVTKVCKNEFDDSEEQEEFEEDAEPEEY